MQVLITGIAGYIGSHCAVALLNAGVDVIGIDNFENSSPAALDRIKALGGRDFAFSEVDIRDWAALDRVFSSRRIDALVHLAGLKSVADSVKNPLSYFSTNVAGSLNLLNSCEQHGCRTVVFSSSATVYGANNRMPVSEDSDLSPINPYGRTKLMVEEMLSAVSRGAGSDWRIGCLRYFNPVGAHQSGSIGEFPRGVPNNLLPLIVQAAAGQRDRILVYGNDWHTRDGTGVRDYIHVMDLAEGHVAALRQLMSQNGSFTLNLGTGRGHSVLEIMNAFERVNRVRVPYEFSSRRDGDVAEIFADVTRAHSVLRWTATRDLDAMCRDHWRWHKQNPRGYV